MFIIKIQCIYHYYFSLNHNYKKRILNYDPSLRHFVLQDKIIEENDQFIILFHVFDG